jgi:Putative transmembrane protein (PGPGW)
MTARERVRQRRERRRRRPLVLRALVALGGFATLAGGVVLLVLPGPGIPLIAVGLGLLALEFAWAEAALARVLRHERVTPTTGRQKVAGAATLVATAAAGAAVVALWWIPGF